MTHEQPMDSSTPETRREAGPQELRRDVEALLFASWSPLTVEAMVNALELPGDLGRWQVEAILATLTG